MEPLYEKLASKVGLCNQRGNIPFIMGGSRELLYYLPSGSHFCVSSSLDMQPLIDSKVTATSIHRALNQEAKKLWLFGVDGMRVSKS
jgi:hypothetical protein